MVCEKCLSTRFSILCEKWNTNLNLSIYVCAMFCTRTGYVTFLAQLNLMISLQIPNRCLVYVSSNRQCTLHIEHTRVLCTVRLRHVWQMQIYHHHFQHKSHRVCHVNLLCAIMCWMILLLVFHALQVYISIGNCLIVVKLHSIASVSNIHFYSFKLLVFSSNQNLSRALYFMDFEHMTKKNVDLLT